MKKLTKEQINTKIDKIFDRYEKDLTLFKVCNLGSCQYWTAEATYKWALAILKLLGLEAFLELIKRKNIGKIPTEQEFSERLWDWKHGYLSDNVKTYPEDLDFQKELANFLKEYPDRSKFTIWDYYESERDMSSDLWSSYANPLQLEKIGEQQKLPTYGPVLNQMVQSENYEVGIALALTTFLYKTDLSVFADFDT